jgi:hypothetical protein
LLFNLDHPDELAEVTEVDDDGDVDVEPDDDESELQLDIGADATDQDLDERLNRLTFVVGTKKLERLPQWVRVSDVFKTDEDAPFLKQAGVTGFDDPRYTRYSARLARVRGIRRYMYRMDILERTLSYDEVTEIFVRVNSLGAKLRGSDLALAQITAKWRNSLQRFLDFEERCTKNGFDLDVGIHLKTLVAFATGQSRFRTVGSISVESLQEAWKRSTRATEFAVDFLKANCGIESPVLLSSPFLVVLLAYYADAHKFNLSPEEARELRRWTLLANCKARYGRGSTETLLDQDLALVRGGGEASDLLERLRLQVGTLDVTAGELEGRNMRSALFKTMFLAFRHAGARDWKNSVQISLMHTGQQQRLQFHHVFPKARLRTQYRPKEVDDIANLAFISGDTNRAIRDRAPAQYLPEMLAERGPGIFEAQAVPTTPELLELTAFPEFVRQRRELIARRLNEFLADEQLSSTASTTSS